ncbi:type II CAAX endopeptidase family protein [Halobellus ordinarius]|uniref:type II CAAX endopeptidase family protein n=1 Tax=Halobellus ordinarius TaxID=3075120 RepID=UPI0028808671|nr:type II CAAX endopeptidase family protein [Halobellus sp. ZY16]
MTQTIEPTIATEPTVTRSGRGRTFAVSVGLLVLAIVAQMVVTIPAAMGYLALGGSLTSPVAFVVLAVLGQIVFLAVGYLFVTRRLGSVRATVPAVGHFGLVAIGSALILAVTLGGTAALAAVGLAAPDDAMLVVAESQPWVLLVFAALSLVLIGPAEELFFRGAVQGNLRTAFGPVTAIGLTSLLFGAVHVTGFLSAGVALSAAVVGSLSLNVLSAVIFGALYERSGNLTIPAIVHGLTNAVGLTVVYLTL